MGICIDNFYLLLTVYCHRECYTMLLATFSMTMYRNSIWRGSSVTKRIPVIFLLPSCYMDKNYFMKPISDINVAQRHALSSNESAFTFSLFR